MRRVLEEPALIAICLSAGWERFSTCGFWASPAVASTASPSARSVQGLAGLGVQRAPRPQLLIVVMSDSEMYSGTPPHWDPMDMCVRVDEPEADEDDGCWLRGDG